MSFQKVKWKHYPQDSSAFGRAPERPPGCGGSSSGSCRHFPALGPAPWPVEWGGCVMGHPVPAGGSGLASTRRCHWYLHLAVTTELFPDAATSLGVKSLSVENLEDSAFIFQHVGVGGVAPQQQPSHTSRLGGAFNSSLTLPPGGASHRLRGSYRAAPSLLLPTQMPIEKCRVSPLPQLPPCPLGLRNSLEQLTGRREMCPSLEDRFVMKG